MPLESGGSRAAISRNIAREREAGKPEKQAIAIAMSNAGKSRDEHEGFEKLEHSLAHEKGVRDPKAVAAAIGREKYGASGMAKKAATGRAHDAAYRSRLHAALDRIIDKSRK